MYNAFLNILNNLTVITKVFLILQFQLEFKKNLINNIEKQKQSKSYNIFWIYLSKLKTWKKEDDIEKH